jgi:hypothetical protein
MSIFSFRVLNPSWKVDIVRVDGANRVEIVKRSDIARYRELAEGGGFYFDTDILFTRSLNDFQFGGNDTGVSFELQGPMRILDEAGKLYPSQYMPVWFSIGSLFSAGDNAFFRAAHEFAETAIDGPDSQSCGIHALLERFGTLDMARAEFPQHTFMNIPRVAFLPVRWDHARLLYTESAGLEREIIDNRSVYGVHWYGGDASASIAESWTEGTYWHGCVLGRLLEVLAMAEAETLREQHAFG